MKLLEYSKKSPLFCSGITGRLYCDFLSEFQTAKPSLEEKPFVFIGKDSIRLLTSGIKELNDGADITATSMSEDGAVEILSFD